jgi:uncharacterized protein with GYD domain
MPAYVSLINFTEQGVRNVKDTVNRARAAAEAAQAAGGRFIGIWWTLGQYDAVLVAEMPDDQTMMRMLLATGLQGNVRTTTLQAYSEQEMEQIVGGLP